MCINNYVILGLVLLLIYLCYNNSKTEKKCNCNN